MEITLDTVFGNPALPINRDYDTFTRPDSDAAGVTEGTGAPWTIMGIDTTGWRTAIRGNQLSLHQPVYSGATTRGLAVVDTSKSDGIFSMRLNAISGGAGSGNAGFVVRVRDERNYIWIHATNNLWSVYRVLDGAPGIIWEGTVPAQFGTVEVHLIGRAIILYVNGVKSVETQYNNFLEATRHGIAVRATPTDSMSSSRFDDFSFTDL